MGLKASKSFLQRLTIASLIAASAYAGQFYDDRPHISHAVPAEEHVVSDQFLQSILDFVLELRILYPENSRYHLGRDGEAIYEVDWMIWRHLDGGKTIEPSLINISRKSGTSPLLIQYLLERRVPNAGMMADTGYEGSVVDAVNHVLEGAGMKKVAAHLISSVHPKSASSRMSTQSYLEKNVEPFQLNAEHKEWYLDIVETQVEQIENAPHFTTTATEYRVNPRTQKLDAYCPQDANPEEQRQSLNLQSQIAYYMRPDGPAMQRAKAALAALGPVIQHLKDGSIEPQEITKAFEFTVENRMHFLWADLRESYAKGAFKAPAGMMHLLWATLPIHQPLLFDLEPLQNDYVLKKEKKRLAEAPSPVKSAGLESHPPLLIEEIMSFHQTEKSREKLRQREIQLKGVRTAVDEGTIVIEGKLRKITDRIDEGVRGEVFGLDGGEILKVPFEADDVRYIAVEIQVADYLSKHYDRYHIRVLPVKAVGPDATYLVRDRLRPEVLGHQIAKGDLTREQMSALERLFLNTKQFAEETGVGLDIKYDNLAWVDGDWVLFDTGPRTSFGPYAFSLDLKDFNEFYRLWKVDDRRKNEMTVDEFIAKYRGGCGGEIATREKKKKV